MVHWREGVQEYGEAIARNHIISLDNSAAIKR